MPENLIIKTFLMDIFMKNYKLILAVLFLCLGISKIGWGLTIVNSGGSNDDTEVGEIDPLKDWTELANSNETTETEWVNKILSPITVKFEIKLEEDLPIYDTSSDEVFAVALASSPTPDYFIVKNAKYWALFENSSYFNWGVFSSKDLPTTMNIPGDYTVSHVTQFIDDGGGTNNEIPEPTTMFLFGTGLAGLAGINRRKKK
ncbi:PEP-CTERM sorting domain-containing protein [Desulfosediminicola flagellatus]|uniref:PEP-CTERM sorting domain-containing protein n=1 Tax=Desulfosediminicola flagellatus TaxID=2569541 RepID=UPI0010AC56BB|nr:PEP-CTERM sorting domain-containing protein [Desulfosediminicola flagellatus]